MATKEDRDRKEEPSIGRLQDFLGFRLRRVRNQLARDFQASTARWQLRGGMFSALEIIAANPEISQTQLSATVGLDKSALGALIDALEQRGWVARERSQSDRRRNGISVTPAGRHELDQMIEALAVAEAPTRALLSPAEMATMIELLDRLHYGHGADR